MPKKILPLVISFAPPLILTTAGVCVRVSVENCPPTPTMRSPLAVNCVPLSERLREPPGKLFCGLIASLISDQRKTAVVDGRPRNTGTLGCFTIAVAPPEKLIPPNTTSSAAELVNEEPWTNFVGLGSPPPAKRSDKNPTPPPTCVPVGFTTTGALNVVSPVSTKPVVTLFSNITPPAACTPPGALSVPVIVIWPLIIAPPTFRSPVTVIATGLPLLSIEPIWTPSIGPGSNDGSG